MYQVLMDLGCGATIVISSADREILGSIPGDKISRFHQNLDPLDRDFKFRRSISCSILHFPPTSDLGGASPLSGLASCPPLRDGRSSMPSRPSCTFGTWWGTQAIHYSWVSLDTSTAASRSRPQGLKILNVQIKISSQGSGLGRRVPTNVENKSAKGHPNDKKFIHGLMTIKKSTKKKMKTELEIRNPN